MIRNIFLLLSLCSPAFSSVMIISKEKQAATVGGNVTLQCRLQASQPNIFQITWQKETGNFTGPIATCSKKYGNKILGPFSNRTAQYTLDTLNVSAITISSVTLEDQGCFKCIFNIYPIGANSGTICLDVYERNISEPIPEVRQSDSQFLDETTTEDAHSSLPYIIVPIVIILIIVILVISIYLLWKRLVDKQAPGKRKCYFGFPIKHRESSTSSRGALLLNSSPCPTPFNNALPV